MKTWQTLLREGDPAADAQLSPQSAERIRRVVVAAAREPQPSPFLWLHPLAMAALVVIMIGVGALIAERAEWADVPRPALSGDHAERRQLQFVTPGGTRIIWTFNSEFELSETLP